MYLLFFPTPLKSSMNFVESNAPTRFTFQREKISKNYVENRSIILIAYIVFTDAKNKKTHHCKVNIITSLRI